jgi:hypothetical protein
MEATRLDHSLNSARKISRVLRSTSKNRFQASTIPGVAIRVLLTIVPFLALSSLDSLSDKDQAFSRHASAHVF